MHLTCYLLSRRVRRIWNVYRNKFTHVQIIQWEWILSHIRYVHLHQFFLPLPKCRRMQSYFTETSPWKFLLVDSLFSLQFFFFFKIRNGVLIRQVRSITRFRIPSFVGRRTIDHAGVRFALSGTNRRGRFSRCREVAGAANWSPISLPLAMQPTQWHSGRVRANVLRPSEQSRRSSRE